mgnify:CR=1 FL=1
MLTETGQVVTLDGQFAFIDVQRKSGCQSCAVKSGCGTSTLAALFNKRFSHVRALNTLQASAGDMVELELNESALVFMTFWTYLFPIVSMFVMSLLVASVTHYNGFAAMAGLVGLVAGLVISRRIIRSRLDTKQLHPVICKIVNSSYRGS